MKKLFTTAFLMLAGIFGGLNAFAEDEVKDLTADMFYTWDGYGADATQVSPAQVDFNLGVELEPGNVVCGTGGVDYLTYADITGSTKLIFEGTAGLTLRVLMNRQESNSGPLVEKQPTFGEDGTVELDLTDYDYVHINAIKINWGASGKVTSIKFVKPGDPLELPKESLKKQISTAKMYNSIAMTEESYASLQNAIADGETALAAEDATVESLEAAKNAIDEAIKGLELAEGYSELTAEMFKEYASVEEPGDGTETGCAYDLFTSSGLAYGDGSVSELKWADLTDYDKFIITVKQGEPRLCMNRLEKDGQQGATQADSKMLDINPNNDFTWSTEAYQTISEDKTIFTIDLKKIIDGTDDLTGYGFARLHCIKGAHYGNVFVTGIYLYKDNTPTAINGVSANEGSADVYTTSGVKVMKGAVKSDLKNLPKGIYIHDGKKIVVK